jgi:hypothetical protein
MKIKNVTKSILIAGTAALLLTTQGCMMGKHKVKQATPLNDTPSEKMEQKVKKTSKTIDKKTDKLTLDKQD